MIEKHIIKSNKQDNGLWGMPLYLKSVDGNMIFKDSRKMELFSAILMSFAECQKQNFSLDIKTNNLFILKTHKYYYYVLDDFGLINNTIYYLPTDDDKILFNRKLKLELIKTKI